MLISLKPQQGCKKAHRKEELVGQVSEVVNKIPEMGASFIQPIRMRMSGLI